MPGGQADGFLLLLGGSVLAPGIKAAASATCDEPK
jgi:hypothetical protein